MDANWGKFTPSVMALFGPEVHWSPTAEGCGDHSITKLRIKEYTQTQKWLNANMFKKFPNIKIIHYKSKKKT